MKIFVTGGMGFIGSNFIRYIFERYPEYVVLNYDALTYAGNPDNLSDIANAFDGKDDARYRFVHGDIVDGKLLEATIRSFAPDIIVNFAAESHVDRSLADSAAFVNSNIVGAHNLFEISRKLNIKLIHVSTDEVYGDVPSEYSHEDSPIRPSNPYAASKAAADLIAQTYIRSHKTPLIIVRGSNNFGPYQYPEKLIPLAITNILEGKSIPVHGDGTHVRTWLHTNDFARGIDMAMHHAPVGSIYNISGDEVSNIDILKKIMRAMGVDPESMLEYVNDRPGADLRYAPTSQKIKRDLGWQPERNIHDDIETLIAWYVANQDWWKKVKERKEFLDHYEKQRQAKYY